jgi:hypothetical protein
MPLPARGGLRVLLGLFRGDAPEGAGLWLARRDENAARLDVSPSNRGDFARLSWELLADVAQFEECVSVETLLFPISPHAINFDCASGNHFPMLAVQLDLLTNFHDPALSFSPRGMRCP